MSALNELAKIKKSKLKTFQTEINALRSGLLGNKTIEEWKGLPDSERKLNITVFLCMAMIPEKELERIAKIINPWWEPFQKLAQVLAAVLVLFLSYQVATFFRAERVYPKVFEYDATFTDGSVKKYGLFDGSSMIFKDSELLDDNIMDWLLMESKKSKYDSTKWTSDKELSQDLKYFYEGFRVNPLMSSDLKDLPLSIEIIYQSTINLVGNKNIKIDLTVPMNNLTSYSPYFINTQPDYSMSSLFISVGNGKNFWNLKIDYKGGSIVNSQNLVFSPIMQIENQYKIVWEKNPFRPEDPVCLKVITNSSIQNSIKYRITDPNIAKPL